MRPLPPPCDWLALALFLAAFGLPTVALLAL